MEHANDFRAFGKFVRPDCLPNVKGIVFDNSYFWLHSQSTLHGCITYTFIHAISEAGTVVFRPLMFDKSELSAAYRYAIAYGCKVNKKPTLDITILDFMADAMEDIDLFVETIQLPTVSRVSRVKHLTPYGKG